MGLVLRCHAHSFVAEFHRDRGWCLPDAFASGGGVSLPFAEGAWMNRCIAASSLALSLFLLAGHAHAAGNQAGRDVAVDFPGVQTSMYNERPSMFYGVPMTSGATADQAADAWLATYGQQYQVGDLDLRLRRTNSVAMGRFTVFAYDQYLDNLPVELSQGRVLVKNMQIDGAMTHEVVLSSARLAKTPVGGFAPVTVTGDEALATGRSLNLSSSSARATSISGLSPSRRGSLLGQRRTKRRCSDSRSLWTQAPAN